ncbi:MAG TPA: hypothetical protein VJU61_13145 [Polyangiaceae bacterium]|nr:hypothetical protein [Polyangiaceae bacterium]
MSKEALRRGVLERVGVCPNTLVVCDDDDTLLRLREYLLRAGVPTRATRQLRDAWKSSDGEAIVLLPDDFATGEVTDGLSRLLSRTQAPFLIIVTAGPRLFEPLIEELGNADSVVIIPKPVWGWTILDLLRGWIGTRT